MIVVAAGEADRRGGVGCGCRERRMCLTKDSGGKKGYKVSMFGTVELWA